jgi:hypothetical protein
VGQTVGRTILSRTLSSSVLPLPKHDSVHCFGVLTPIPLPGVATRHSGVQVPKTVLHTDLRTPGIR